MTSLLDLLEASTDQELGQGGGGSPLDQLEAQTNAELSGNPVPVATDTATAGPDRGFLGATADTFRAIPAGANAGRDDLVAMLARAFGDAPTANRVDAQTDRNLELAGADRGLPRYVAGIGRSLVPMVAGAPLGPVGTLVPGVGVSLSQAAGSADKAGITGVDKLRHVFTQGAWEAVPELVAQKLGLGGAEQLLADAFRRGGESGLKLAVKELIKAQPQEVGTELVTSFGQAAEDKRAGVDQTEWSAEQAANIAVDTTLQTLLLTGAAGAPRVAMAALADRARAQEAPAQAQDYNRKRLAELGGDPGTLNPAQPSATQPIPADPHALDHPLVADQPQADPLAMVRELLQGLTNAQAPAASGQPAADAGPAQPLAAPAQAGDAAPVPVVPPAAPVEQGGPATVQMMVTSRMRRDLTNLGYKRGQIDAMKPDEAAAAIRDSRGPEPIQQTAAPAPTGQPEVSPSTEKGIPNGQEDQGQAEAETLLKKPETGEWKPFPADSGTLGVPRGEMPQIKSEQRGALSNFLRSRGIEWSREDGVDPRTLKPTQAEFSPGKVEKARKFAEPSRAILVSADGHVVDGHHQWVAALHDGKPIDVVRLQAPIRDALAAVREFPSSTTAGGAAQTGGMLPKSISETSAQPVPKSFPIQSPETVKSGTNQEQSGTNSGTPNASITVGQRVRFTKGSKKGTEATVASITADGRPVLKTDDGKQFGGNGGIDPNNLEVVNVDVQPTQAPPQERTAPADQSPVDVPPGRIQRAAAPQSVGRDPGESTQGQAAQSEPAPAVPVVEENRAPAVRDVPIARINFGDMVETPNGKVGFMRAGALGSDRVQVEHTDGTRSWQSKESLKLIARQNVQNLPTPEADRIIKEAKEERARLDATAGERIQSMVDARIASTQAPAVAKPSTAKLRQGAAAMAAKTDDDLGRDRQSNTRRRASMAASAIKDASQRKADATTAQNVADAIDRGEGGSLSKVSTMLDVVTLRRLLDRAVYRARQASPDRMKWINGSSETDTSNPTDEEIRSGVKGDDIEITVNGEWIRKALDEAKGTKGLPAIRSALGSYFPDRYRAVTTAQIDALRELAGRSKWYGENIKGAMEQPLRLRRLGISNYDDLRNVLVELNRLRSAVAGESRAAKLEREIRFRKIPGFFPTPPAMAAEVISKADIQPGMRVLEPEAGKGDLAELAEKAGGKVDVAESVSDLREILTEKGFTPVASDMLEMRAPADGPVYDRIVMNPPFENGQDREHVRHAYDLLKPGGRLVAIMSPGPFQRSFKADQDFKVWADSVGAVVENNEQGSFAGKDAFRQTGVSTVTVTIDKRAETARPTVSARQDQAIVNLPLDKRGGGSLDSQIDRGLADERKRKQEADREASAKTKANRELTRNIRERLAAVPDSALESMANKQGVSIAETRKRLNTEAGIDPAMVERWLNETGTQVAPAPSAVDAGTVADRQDRTVADPKVTVQLSDSLYRAVNAAADSPKGEVKITRETLYDGYVQLNVEGKDGAVGTSAPLQPEEMDRALREIGIDITTGEGRFRVNEINRILEDASNALAKGSLKARTLGAVKRKGYTDGPVLEDGKSTVPAADMKAYDLADEGGRKLVVDERAANRRMAGFGRIVRGPDGWTFRGKNGVEVDIRQPTAEQLAASPNARGWFQTDPESGRPTIYLVPGNTGPFTLDHELVHAAVAAGIISRKELAALVRIGVKRGIADEVRKLGYRRQVLAEEVAAHVIEAMHSGRIKATPGFVERLLEWVRSLSEAMGIGQRSDLQIARDVASGRQWSQSAQDMTDAERMDRVLPAPGQSLAFRDLLRQWRRANGDRTPVPGSQEWKNLVLKAREIDARNGRRFSLSQDQTDERTPEQRMQDNQGAPEGIRQAQDRKEFMVSFRRHFQNLDPADNAEAIRILREFEARLDASAGEAAREINRFVEGLSVEQAQNFAKQIEVADIVRQIESGEFIGNDSQGRSPQDILVQVQAMLTETERAGGPEVAAAVAKRRAYQRQHTRKLVEAKLLDETALDDDRYFHRQVMAHMSNPFAGLIGNDQVRNRTRGFQRDRSGGTASDIPFFGENSRRDFNTAYHQAEFEYLSQSMQELAKVDVLAKIRQQFDRLPEVKAEAKARNRAAMDEWWQREVEAQGGAIDNPERGWDYPYRATMAINNANLADLAADSGGRWGGPFDHVWQKLANARNAWRGRNDSLDPADREPWTFNHPEWWPALSWLVTRQDLKVSATKVSMAGRASAYEGTPSIHAGAILKAISEREQFTKKTLSEERLAGRGPGYQTWQSVAKELEGFTEWQPEKGLQLGQGYVLEDADVRAALVQAGVDPDAFAEHAPDVLPVGEAEARRGMVVYGKKPVWLIPEEIAAQLDDLEARTPKTPLQKRLELGMRTWKQWILMNPLSVVRYNINNAMGDLDVALTNPGTLREIARDNFALSRDLWNFTQNNPQDAETRAFFEAAERTGLIDSGVQVAELPDVDRIPGLGALFGKKPETINQRTRDLISRYFGTVQRFSRWREGLTRLGAARNFMQQISPERRRYAASRRDEMDQLYDDWGASIKRVSRLEEAIARRREGEATEQELSDLAEAQSRARELKASIAAKLARELIGDYGALSVSGQWLRRSLIPFWSWMEINLPRYVRLINNARYENGGGTSQAIGASLALTGGMALRMTALTAGVFAWNAVMKAALDIDDEEDPNKDADLSKMQIILGRDGDGKVYGIRVAGAMMDALGWFDGDATLRHIKEVTQGMREGKTAAALRDVAEDVGMAPVNRLASSVNPALKEGAAQATGRDWFPDVRKPRPIGNRLEHAVGAVGLGKVAQAAADKIPWWKAATGAVIAETDPRTAATYRIRDQVEGWASRNGVTLRSMGGEPTERNTALRQARAAFARGERERALRWMADYYDMGGKPANLGSSKAGMHLLSALNKSDWARFTASLDTQDRAALARAVSQWKEFWDQPNEGFRALAIQAWRERPARKPEP